MRDNCLSIEREYNETIDVIITEINIVILSKVLIYRFIKM